MRRSSVDRLHRDELGGRVSVDTSDGAPVLAGEPVVGEMQVDARRLDRHVPGLCLDRFEFHPGLAEPGQAGVAELVARRPLQPGALAGPSQDRVDPVAGQRLPACRSLQRDEHPVGGGVSWSFVAEVVTDRGEEHVRDRDDALVAALALGDEQRALWHLHVSERQAEDLTST